MCDFCGFKVLCPRRWFVSNVLCELEKNVRSLVDDAFHGFQLNLLCAGLFSFMVCFLIICLLDTSVTGTGGLMGPNFRANVSFLIASYTFLPILLVCH